MPYEKKKFDLKQLKQQLKLLTIEQDRDLRLLRDYKEKDIPANTKFFKQKQKETRFRSVRINNLKEKIKSLDKA